MVERRSGRRERGDGDHVLEESIERHRYGRHGERQGRGRGRISSESIAFSWMTVVILLALFLVRKNIEYVDEVSDRSPLLQYTTSKVGAHVSVTFEIFSAPKPFVGIDKINQLRAIESWLALIPPPKITLLGEGELYEEVAKEYGLRRIRDVDSSFLGVPLFNSMVAIANRSRAPVAVLINSDIMLFDDFPYVIRKIAREFHRDWVAVGARWDIETLPGNPSFRGPHQVRGSEKQRIDTVNHIREHGTLHTYGGIDIWAWNTAGLPLFQGTMPHFVFGRGKYDNWFTHEIIASGDRAVIDISEACTLAHIRHDHHLLASSKWNDNISTATRPGPKRSFWNDALTMKFEPYINSYLATRYGSYSNQKGTILHAEYKIQSCYESEGICTFRRVNPHACRCEHSPFVSDAQSDPYVVNDSRVIFCGLISADASHEGLDVNDRYPINGRSKPRAPTAFGLPLVFEHLMDVISPNKSSAEQRPVVVTMLKATHKDLLMNFVCNLRHFGIFKNLLIAALDNELYRFAVTRGLPVYLEESLTESAKDESNIDAWDRSPSDSDILRVQLLDRVIKTGRDVLYLDPDVVLLANPLAKLLSTSLDFALASLAEAGSPTNRRADLLRTGIMFARSNQRTIKLFRKMMELKKKGMGHLIAIHEAACGKDAKYRQGEQACRKDGLSASVAFFDQSVFSIFPENPEGSQSTRRVIGLLNEASSVLSKMESIRTSGYRFVDQESALCTYPKHIVRYQGSAT